ncbi:MAG: hypothetical protein KC800_10595, partial [Candidatus Eremiobacteraeota bacterium]|nr:hypothetical protein [Candidatus Eremiobacteraeota bacterium]
LKSTKARRRAFVCSLGLLASIVVGFSPWFPPVLKLAREGWVRATVTRTPVEALQGRAMPGGPEAQLDSTDIVLETLGRLAGKWTLGEVPPPGDWRPTQILQLALALFGAGVLVMKDRKTAVLVGFILSTGLLYVVLAAAPLLVYSRVYLYVRHIAFAYPFFLALQGTAIGFLWRKSRLAGAILVGAYVLSLLPALSFYYRINKQDWRGASEFLMAHVASGDQVVVDCADWGVLAYLQMHGFQLTYDRVRTFEVHRGSTTLTFINPTVPYDSGKRLWWVHAQSSAAPEEILDPQHLRFQSDWGYLGGVIEIYQHGP